MISKTRNLSKLKKLKDKEALVAHSQTTEDVLFFRSNLTAKIFKKTIKYNQKTNTQSSEFLQ